jgi:hypothetical protein
MSMQATIGSVQDDRRHPGSRWEVTTRWRSLVGYLLACVILIAPFAAKGQQATIVHRIGLFNPGFPPALRASNSRVEAFRQGLRELGYVEGQNLVGDTRQKQCDRSWIGWWKF